MDDLARWLGEQFDADALWAMEASRRYGEPAPEGGAHWQWEDSDTDEIIIPDPGREEVVGGESFRVALRSRETWPTHSVGELPQFAIPEAEEVPSAVGGHIVRWDPARVLREIAIDHELLREYEQLLRAHARHEKAAEELATDIEHENRTGKWEGPGNPGTRQGALRREADYLPAMLHVMERWARSKAAVYNQRPGYREEWRP